MRIGVVVDASCDLPEAYIETHGLVVVPGPIRFGDRTVLDRRESRETLDWYRRELTDRRLDARTMAPAIEQIRDLFLDDLVLRYDRILMLCMSASRGRVFANATEASYEILRRYRERRAAVGISEPFALRVLDTRNIGPGEGILAQEAVAMLDRQAPPFEKLRRAIKDRRRQIVSYLVPDDLYFLRRRAVDKGERAISSWTYRLGSWFDWKPLLEMRGARTSVADRVRGFDAAVGAALERARRAVRAGHVRGSIAMSYGGDPRRLHDLPAFDDFEAFAVRRKIDLHVAVMSATLAVNVGPGAFALAWLED
jgi:DegV family protein with EDD domain